MAAVSSDTGRVRSPRSTAWISEELLQSTRRVWSKVYRRPVGEEEAQEILMNVKNVAEVVLKATSEGQVS